MTFIIFWFTNIYNRLLLEVRIGRPLVVRMIISKIFVTSLHLQRVLLKEGSEMLDYYVNPPIDPIIKVYVFNYTNIDDVLSGLQRKMKVKEVGPYFYRERVVKTSLTTENDKITFFVSH
jgi:CD36 family